jgi:predicted nucleic acid-binding protein
MILIDTSIWIEFFRDRDLSISDRLIEYLENGLAVGLSCVFGELLQGVKTEEEEKIILEFWRNIPKVDEKFLFIEAGKLSGRYKLITKGVGLIDCYLLAAAKTHSLNIWTLDRRLSEAFSTIK